MMQPQTDHSLRNLMMAMVLSTLVLWVWHTMYEAPRQQQIAQQKTEAAQRQAPAAAQPGQTSAFPAAEKPVEIVPHAKAIAAAPRVAIESPKLKGSLSLRGARFDDLTLLNFRTHADPLSPPVMLFAPSQTQETYFAEFGWLAMDATVKVPDATTLWHADKNRLVPGEKLLLHWENGQGLRFIIEVTLDENYLFTFTRGVENASSAPVELMPYGLLSRTPPPAHQAFAILHEGPIGVFEDRTLAETTYQQLLKDKRQQYNGQDAWLGISDKYWLAALIPSHGEAYTGRFSFQGEGTGQRYQVDYLHAKKQLAPGESLTLTDHLFAGAKEVDLLDSYGAMLGIPLFDRAVDFGVLYFLTKPIFLMLKFFHGHVGNFGVAILLLTVVIKGLLFPLANKSYIAMAQMKRIQPEVMRLRELHKDDKMQMNKAMMELYKREKVNPAAGCLPMLIQIPVFFALYKVLFVSIEMRHAPFFGWIHDLSAPDPSNLFTLFGLIPWDAPGFLHIGVWPLVMGITMGIQQALNPKPADETQAKIMAFLPYIFTYLFASFPAGLVLYWAWNNVLSILQQLLITKVTAKKKLAGANA